MAICVAVSGGYIPHADCRAVPTWGYVSIATRGFDLSVVVTVVTGIPL